jgi:hypothetical protein
LHFDFISLCLAQITLWGKVRYSRDELFTLQEILVRGRSGLREREIYAFSLGIVVALPQLFKVFLKGRRFCQGGDFVPFPGFSLRRS